MKLSTAIDIHALKDAKVVPVDDTLTYHAYKTVRWGVDENTGEIHEPGHPITEKSRKKFRNIINKHNLKHVVGGIFHPDGNGISKRQIHSGKEEYEMETRPEPQLPTARTKRIVMKGTQYCVVADGVDKNFGCYPSRRMAQAVMNGKAFIEPEFPENIMAGGVGSGRHKEAMREFTRIYKLAKQAGHKDEKAKEIAKKAYMDKFQHVYAGGPGSGRKKSASGLNKWKSRDEELTNARKDPKQMKLFPVKMKASMYDTSGEPLAGALQQVHMDTNGVWFKPPSLKNAKPVPTDDPKETDDKFGDVTKRNSKDTKEQRMKLLKRQAPGGLPPQVPARTTQVEPLSPYYNPGGLNAAAARFRARKRRLMVKEAGSFRAFGAARI